MILSVIQTIIKPIFGQFEPEELKKFMRMGVIFSFIIGSYWTLRPLKNAIFCTLVGASQIPWAKTASLICLVPVIMIYTKLLDRYNREQVFYIISVVYSCLAFIFGVFLIYNASSESACYINQVGAASWLTFVLGYAYYIFVEGYGSLIPALFWAIASDTTKPESAKKGFSFIVAIGQLGGIVGPYFITSLPRRLGFASSGLSLFICALTIGGSILLLRNFFKKTPAELLASFHGKNEDAVAKGHEPSFFEGLYLLLKHKYLLGIFAVIAFPEIITAMVDFHFNLLASEHYSGVHLAEYLGLYATAVNLIALTFLLLGISNITRIFGIGASLILMPIIYGLAMFGFISFNSLTFLFILMASSKAINYALNGPAIKQLYIPTSHDVRFKSQAWIESFGSRGSKELGVSFGFFLGPLQNKLGAVVGKARHALLSGYISFGITFVWLFIAFYLGKKHKEAIAENKVVC